LRRTPRDTQGDIRTGRRRSTASGVATPLQAKRASGSVHQLRHRPAKQQLGRRPSRLTLMTRKGISSCMSGRRPYSYSSRTIPVRTQSNKQAEGVEPPFGVSPGGGLDAMARVRAVDETPCAGFAHDVDANKQATMFALLYPVT